MDYEMLIGELETYLADMGRKAEEDSGRYLKNRHPLMQALGRTEQGKADAYHDVLCKLEDLEKDWRCFGKKFGAKVNGSFRK